MDTQEDWRIDGSENRYRTGRTDGRTEQIYLSSVSCYQTQSSFFISHSTDADCLATIFHPMNSFPSLFCAVIENVVCLLCVSVCVMIVCLNVLKGFKKTQFMSVERDFEIRNFTHDEEFF